MPIKSHGKQTGQPTTRSLPTPTGGVRLETFVPWKLVKTTVKKQVIMPPGSLNDDHAATGSGHDIPPTAKDSALMRALGLAHYWQMLLDKGLVPSAADIAKAENINVTQVRRLLRLTLKWTLSTRQKEVEFKVATRRFIMPLPVAAL